MKKIKKIVVKIIRWFEDTSKRSVMLIYLDWDKGTIECDDWISERIRVFSKPFTLELWNEIKRYTRKHPTDCKMGTQIIIWKDGKRVASDIINPYLENADLLKTGNGYTDYWMEVYRKKDDSKNKCPNCGHQIQI